MMRNIIAAIIMALSCETALLAQAIPNAGFENWKKGDPGGWMTSNSVSNGSITRSTDSHSGAYAAQGNVISVSGVNLPPDLFIGGVMGPGFPVNGRPAVFHGFYKLTVKSGDALLITVGLVKNGSVVGSGLFTSGTSADTYKEFEAAIRYIAADVVPDSAFIIITLKGHKPGIHVGSTFKIDDLSFGSASGAKK